ncbi:hypothetical protein PR202_gb26416 [Eleusine coracana subsp. coracana]|uniref:Aminoacyl-transfer RNA synthetases class-II family profile domain-containing protein n=1 Tax=Eleusine coracana subsp. coracana TaxID=191504 RepID=A0AAV5FRG3_ELECO|nr:hypothetical protein PR202_gb26416 [Eleusine coracana subsp. coracana]
MRSRRGCSRCSGRKGILCAGILALMTPGEGCGSAAGLRSAARTRASLSSPFAIAPAWFSCKDMKVSAAVEQFLDVHEGFIALVVLPGRIISQVTTLPEYTEVYNTVNKLRVESVVAIEGVVRPRPTDAINADMKTGAIEVAADHILVLNTVARSLPFPVTTADTVKEKFPEEIRLRYRVLDLHRQQMQSNLRLRHSVVKLIRRYLEDKHDFVEIETPVLSKSTPEGARDYLVPSRVQPGTFYALPQSPQLFKQMLMVSGFEKYYQIARCFRDEDLRADRQPEFTQLDMEIAFTSMEDMLKLNEELMRHIFEEVGDIKVPNPFPRLTYAEAMNRYGTDRPDLRFDWELKDVRTSTFLENAF